MFPLASLPLLLCGSLVLAAAAGPPIDDEDAATTTPPTDTRVIAQMTHRLRYDCGNNGTFTYCPRNLYCVRWIEDGTYDLYHRRETICDPLDPIYYGCQCKGTSMLNGKCSPVSCYSLMKQCGFGGYPAGSDDDYDEEDGTLVAIIPEAALAGGWFNESIQM